MKITRIRAINCSIAIKLALTGYAVYDWYLAVVHLSLEVLNSRRRYLK